jgi:hypothetical protein
MSLCSNALAKSGIVLRKCLTQTDVSAMITSGAYKRNASAEER